MLVGSPLGCTERVLLAHGFTVGMRGLLVLDGPADGGAGDRACRRAADPGDLVTITDLGRQALAGTWRRGIRTPRGVGEWKAGSVA
jgi:hypothetical protein